MISKHSPITTKTLVAKYTLTASSLPKRSGAPKLLLAVQKENAHGKMEGAGQGAPNLLVLPSPTKQTRQLLEALRLFLSNTLLQLLESLDLLRSYCANLLHFPADSKFRRISTNNVHFRERLGSLAGANAVLQALGFEQSAQTDCWVMREERLTTLLQAGLREMTSVLVNLHTQAQDLFKAQPVRLDNTKHAFTAVQGAGHHGSIGKRMTMEDDEILLDNFAGERWQAYFGLYDGHGGRDTVDFIVKSLHLNVEHALRSTKHERNRDVAQLLRRAYLQTDASLRKQSVLKSGTTAVSCLVLQEPADCPPSSAITLQQLAARLPSKEADEPTSPSAAVAPQADPPQTPSSSSSEPAAAASPPAASAATTIASSTPAKPAAAAHPSSSSEIPLSLSLPWTSSSFPAQSQAATGKSAATASAPSVFSAAASSSPSSNTPSDEHKSSRRMLYVANVGDSRAVLIRNGQAICMTVDHRPSDPQEDTRIKNAGGYVRGKRVNGVLAVSRALGDHLMLKDNGVVSAEPHVCATEITNQDSFLLMACDGVWDVVSNQDAVNFMLAELKKLLGPSFTEEWQPKTTEEQLRLNEALNRSCEALVDRAIDLRSQDNVTGTDADIVSTGATFTNRKQEHLPFVELKVKFWVSCAINVIFAHVCIHDM
eukprot:g57233.t1